MNIALFLSADGIALAHRQPAGHWAMIGETALDGGEMDAALADLRALAVEREGSDFEALLVLPDDQILYTSLTAPTDDPELTAFRIEEGLDGLTPYTITELEYDWRVQEQDRVKIAVVARETLDEARGFAAQHGFVGAGFAAMPPMQRFPGVPLFDLSDAAKGMDFAADGIAFGGDVYGLSEDEVAELEAEAAPEPEVVPEAEPEATADEADAGEAQESGAHEPEAPVAAFANEGAPSEHETEDEASDAGPEEDVPDASPAVVPGTFDEGADDPSDPTETSEASALAVALQMSPAIDTSPATQPIADPSQSGPIAPNTDDDLEDADLPPAPSPAAAEARERARLNRSEPPLTGAAKSDSSATSEAADRGTFAARRTRVTPPDGMRDSLVGKREARFGPTSAKVERPEDLPDTPGAPTTGPGAKMPRLSEQLERVRTASKSRTKGPDAPARRPRVEITPQPPLDGPGLTGDRPNPFDLPTPGQASPEAAPERKPGLLGGFRRSKAAPPPDAGSSGEAGALTADAATGTTVPGRTPMFQRTPKASAANAPATTTSAPATEDGTEAPTEFSSGMLARKAAPKTGASFKTGLILTVILLLLLAVVAVWSAFFLPDSAVARLLTGRTAQQQVMAPEVSTDTPLFGTTTGPAPTATEQPDMADEAAADGIDIAALEPEALPPETVAPLTDVSVDDALIEDEGDLSAAPDPAEGVATDPEDQLFDIDADFELPPLPEIDPGQNPSVEEAEALYAEDQIWARSPERPTLNSFDLLDQVYTASIDPEVSTFDAVALPEVSVNPGELLRRFPPPPAFGTAFNLTDGGLIAPTPDGVLSPEGAFLVAGPPPVTAIPRDRSLEVQPTAPIIDAEDAVLQAFRPTERPNDLIETRERQVLGGLTTNELSEVRPPERPESPQEAAAQASLFPGGDAGTAALDPDLVDPDVVEDAITQAIGGSDLAIASSLLPTQRPADIAQIVESATRAPAPATTVVAPEAVAAGPSIPSNADVSRAATERNAIRLRNVNLIGVTGTPSDRRALVRLASGRFVRVGVGDRLDGGNVAAIGETTLQYVRSGRTVTLEIPG